MRRPRFQRCFYHVGQRLLGLLHVYGSDIMGWGYVMTAVGGMSAVGMRWARGGTGWGSWAAGADLTRAKAADAPCTVTAPSIGRCSGWEDLVILIAHGPVSRPTLIP